jgi:hypothetical protein
MSNSFGKIILALIAIVFFYFYVSWLYRLTSNAYYIDETKLYKLDTFHLLNRAYETSKSRGRGSSREQLKFQSKDGYSFSIEANVFLSVINKQQLNDTLMYDDIAFIPYTNKKYFDKYISIKYAIYIKVYQIQIGNTKYINIENVNSLNKRSLLIKIILFSLVIALVTLIIKVKPLREKLSKKLFL